MPAGDAPAPIPFDPPPPTAAWWHHEARAGFEVTYFHRVDEGYRIEGCTTAIEGGHTWAVDYTILVDATWVTRRARISGRSDAGARSTTLDADGAGRWWVDGAVAPHLDGCLDVDLESSAMTNALPVHRMGLAVGDRSSAPAAYVRAVDLAVERLEQNYMRLADERSHHRFEYDAPVFDFACRLVYDRSGLVVDYPGIAVRAS